MIIFNGSIFICHSRGSFLPCLHSVVMQEFNQTHRSPIKRERRPICGQLPGTACFTFSICFSSAREVLIRKDAWVILCCFEQYLEDEYKKGVREDDPMPPVQPYHYGSHYSNSGTVLHFLVRMPPFTKMFLAYQGESHVEFY